MTLNLENQEDTDSKVSVSEASDTERIVPTPIQRFRDAVHRVISRINQRKLKIKQRTGNIKYVNIAAIKTVIDIAHMKEKLEAKHKEN